MASDELADLKKALRELNSKKGKLEDRIEILEETEEKLAAKLEHEHLSAEEKVKTERDLLKVKRDLLKVERDLVKKEEGLLKVERDLAKMERDLAKSQGDEERRKEAEEKLKAATKSLHIFQEAVNQQLIENAKFLKAEQHLEGWVFTSLYFSKLGCPSLSFGSFIFTLVIISESILKLRGCSH